MERVTLQLSGFTETSSSRAYMQVEHPYIHASKPPGQLLHIATIPHNFPACERDVNESVIFSCVCLNIPLSCLEEIRQGLCLIGIAYQTEQAGQSTCIMVNATTSKFELSFQSVIVVYFNQSTLSLRSTPPIFLPFPADCPPSGQKYDTGLRTTSLFPRNE